MQFTAFRVIAVACPNRGVDEHVLESRDTMLPTATWSDRRVYASGDHDGENVDL
jgi:hypothetical protein